MEPDPLETNLLWYILVYNNIFMPNASDLDAEIKVRPCEKEKELHELQSHWKDYFANKPDKPIFWMGRGYRHVYNHCNQITNSAYVH